MASIHSNKFKYLPRCNMVDNLELKPQPDLENRIKAMKDDGYAYFPDALSQDEISELKSIMDDLTPIEASFNRHTTVDNGGLSLIHI